MPTENLKRLSTDDTSDLAVNQDYYSRGFHVKYTTDSIDSTGKTNGIPPFFGLVDSCSASKHFLRWQKIEKWR